MSLHDDRKYANKAYSLAWFLNWIGSISKETREEVFNIAIHKVKKL